MAMSLKPNAAGTRVRTYLLLIRCLSFLISTVAIPISTNITAPLLTFPTNNDISKQCTSARTWIGPAFRHSDCITAIDRIFREAMERANQEYEFLYPGAAPKTSLPTIMTPRKYIHNSCVVTIATLDQFVSEELPGSDPSKKYEETDVALLEDAWYAASTVDFACLQYGRAGWIATGKQKSIGLLIMASGSAEDRTIPDLPPHVAGRISTPVGLVNLSHITDIVEERG